MNDRREIPPPCGNHKGLRFGVATVLGALLLVATTVRSDDVKSDKETKEKQAAAASKDANQKWKPLFDGKTLKGWEKSEFGGQGEVVVENGEISLGMSDGCTGITWKGDFPKVDYEVAVEAKRVDGTDFFCGMTFPVADSPCSLIVGGWGGTVVGLSSIDGKDAANNETTQGMRFEQGRWYKIKVRVTAEKIQAWIDDKQIIDQSIVGRKISIRPEVGPSKPFGIASWCTTAALKNIELRSLEKKPD